jgi:cephalosporin hydroxylase
MNYIEDLPHLSLSELLPFIQNRILRKTNYFGIKTLKNPMDFWIYQEIIVEQYPDVIIEIGNNWGGSTLALAHLLDNLNHGRIIGVDIDHSKVSSKVQQHQRITLIENDAVIAFDQVKGLINPDEKVLVIEDSAHTYDNTLKVLKLYSNLIREDGYLIVEDSICHHGLEVGPMPGPYEAIEDFIAERDDFIIDRDKESFLITWNPKGFLKKIK